MKPLLTILSLTGYFACAQLSFEHAVAAVECQHEVPGGAKVCVRLDGPLNILRAHPLTSNDMADCVPANQKTYSDAAQSWKENPAQSSTCEDAGRMEYQRAYNEIKQLMLPDESGMGIRDAYRSTPVYEYLSKRLSADEQARFFALMLLLTGGSRCKYKPSETMPQTGAVHSHRAQRRRPPMLWLDLSSREGDSQAAGVHAVRAVMKFFIEHGFTYEKKYGLHYPDSPSFLIHSYICKFARGYAFVDRVFGYVYEFIGYIHTGNEIKLMRERLFTSDEKLFAAYSKKFEALRAVHSLSISPLGARIE
ncbi:hypothetical protein PAPHI01_1135 [Pancytospora philotis]|nr:hypothetical protein PAPHI01_1135 [Pancytospora philotis]